MLWRNPFAACASEPGNRAARLRICVGGLHSRAGRGQRSLSLESQFRAHNASWTTRRRSPGISIKRTKRKRRTWCCVLIGRRYLALDIKAKLVYNVLPSDLQAKGQDFASGDLFVKSRVLPTDNWSLRDVGPAELIKLTLGDYGRELYVELPHMPDMRAFY